MPNAECPIPNAHLMLDWNDLRCVLTIARSGNIAAAAPDQY